VVPSMPEPEYSPLTRLVLFLVCLSLVGGLAAGIHYFAIDLPQQKTLPAAPENSAPAESCPYPRGGPYYTICYEYMCYQNCCQSTSEMTIVMQGPCMF